MLMTGKIKIIEKEGDVTVSERDAKTNVTQPCTDENRQRVKAQIAGYINSGPSATKKTAEPVKASSQKK
jgi:hypothetical protein